MQVPLPADHEHAFNAEVLAREEEEYGLADALLCPSDFVVKTFVERGYPKHKLLRFIYGVDENVFHPGPEQRHDDAGLTMIFVGVCAVRKGLHFALEAWLGSTASESGQFLIAGEFLPEYREKLAPLLAHPSVKVLGHRSDIPDLMRKSDLFVLPSIEEGFGLVCTEAMATGCVPLVSDACTDLCEDGKNALVHPVGNSDILRRHIDYLDRDRQQLANLRRACLAALPSISWAAAGHSLVRAYSDLVGVRQPH